MLNIQNLSFSFDSSNKIIDNFNYSLEKGKIYTLLGYSGIGKSTLFRLILGFLSPSSGSISYPLSSKEESLAYMPQKDLLLPWLSIKENLCLPLFLKEKQEKPKDWDLFLTLLEVESLLDKKPGELSIGMRQRVFFLQTLFQDKPIYLLDEPFSSLDVKRREALFFLLLRKKEEGKTLFISTHDFRDALFFSDEILLLNKGTLAKKWVLDKTVRENSSLRNTLQEEIRLSFF